MKLNVSFAALCAVLMFAVNAQFRSIPAAATNAFKEEFPKAVNVTWHDRLSSFRADFEIGKEKYEANFSNKGEWIKTQKYPTYDKIPAAVIDGFRKSKFANWHMTDFMQIEELGKELQYRISVRVNQNTGARRDLYFTAAGQLIKDTFSL